MNAPAPIRIRELRLVGARGNYEVPFTDGGDPRDLSVIAGQIATGKTTVLDFINWCLGAKRHPEHDEVLENVRTAQLAIDVLDRESVLTKHPQYLSYVIDRPLGGESSKAWLYSGTLSEMSEVPLKSLISDSSDSESLSQWLLQACGLSGMRLKQAPSKAESKTSALSFLDLRPLWFLSNKRMGSSNLALEAQPQVAVKLVQVVDLFFGVSDDEASARARRIEELSTEQRELRRSLDTLNRFLDDADFQNLEEIAVAKDHIETELAAVTARRSTVDAHLKSESTFADDLRKEYESAVVRVGQLTTRLRDRDTLLRRLGPLRAQYADEVRRLDLLNESLTLFDSLAVTTCPACQSKLTSRVDVVAGQCTLCHETVKSGPVVEDPTYVDLASERRSLNRRLNQLKDFTVDVSREISTLDAEITHAQGVVRNRQQVIDEVTRDAVSPFLAARDELAAKQGELTAAFRVLKQSERVMRQLEQMERDLRQVTSALTEEKDRLRSHSQLATDRDTVLELMSERMEMILRDFGFPKIDTVHIDKKLVPFVRGKRYDRVGSSGAMTLISLAWTLSIYELAVERGGGHPGILLVDGPQQNLLPDAPQDDEDDELASELRASRGNIATNVYLHIREWLAKNPTAQIIVVDNAPPEVATSSVVVRYSGDPAKPPYGLIDNADGTEVTRE